MGDSNHIPPHFTRTRSPIPTFCPEFEFAEHEHLEAQSSSSTESSGPSSNSATDDIVANISPDTQTRALSRRSQTFPLDLDNFPEPWVDFVQSSTGSELFNFDPNNPNVNQNLLDTFALSLGHQAPFDQARWGFPDYSTSVSYNDR